MMKVVLVALMLVAITHAGSLPASRDEQDDGHGAYGNPSLYHPNTRDFDRPTYSYGDRDRNSTSYSSNSYENPNHDNRRYEIPRLGSLSNNNRNYVNPGYERPAYLNRSRYQRPDNDSRRYQRPGNVKNEYGSPNLDIPGDDILHIDSHTKESPDSEESVQEDSQEIAQEDPSSVSHDGPVCAMVCRYAGVGVFEAGQQYQYEYQGQVTSRALATHGHESQMGLTATLIISANTPCDLKLQVVDVLIEDVPDEDSQWFAEAVQTHDLHFSYQGGRIEHLCTHPDEDAIITNFKRGILSALQTSLLNLDERDEVVVQERDVSGECETLYTVSHEPNDHSGMVVNKTKSRCRGNTHLPYLPHANHAFLTPNTDLPILRSSQSCQMHRHGNAWERVECTQEIVVDGPQVPSVSHSSLASFTIVSSLLLQAGPYDLQDTFVHESGRRKIKSLQMDLEGAVDSDEARQPDILDQIGDTLENLLISTKGKFEEEEQRPHMFSKLVSLLGHLTQQDDLDHVWNIYGSQEFYREVVVDALLVCERGPCVQLVVRLAQDSHPALPPSTLSTWLTGLHFHTHTDPLAISYVLEVAESRGEVAGEVVMAVSSMVHRVCQHDPHHCRKHARPFLNYVRKEVGDSCGRGGADGRQQHVKLMLRALGNAGIQPDNHFSEKCYMNRLLPPEVRVAALQTLRRGGCLRSNSPWKILEDVEEKIDVRLAAYLSLIPCATHHPGFFHRINTLLEKENVNQVGSYIWTHICNLAEQPGISDHSRQLATLAAQLSLHDKFNTNPLRSSRNYRYAHFSEKFNLGGSVDSDVIFTPDSYLPRRAALNLTLDLMDKSINILEFGGDFNGLEKYVERFFGKGGYFENEGIENVLESLRPKRDIQDDKIQEFQSLYDEARTINELEPSMEEAPRASVFLRVFGNEVVHLDNALKSNPLQFLQQLVKEFSSPKSFQIVNQELVRSTLLGFPLRMKVNATGIVTFSRTGKFEVSGTQRILLEGKISPSAVMAMDEMILVDGYICSSGIRRTTTRMARSDFGGKLSLENGQIVDVQFNVPGQEVGTVSSSVKVSIYKNLKKDWEEQLPDSPLKLEKYCSPESFNNILGLQVCRSLSYGTRAANGKIFVSEPYDTKVTVAKTDTFENYTFSFNKVDSSVTAVFDTPGSSIDRRVSVQAEVKPESAEGSIIIPGKGIEGQYENSEALQKLSLTFYSNSMLQGEFEISLQNVKEGKNTKYSPKLHLSLDNYVQIHVNGSLLMGPDVFKAKANIMTSLQAEPVEFQASWEDSGGRQQAAAKITHGQSFISSAGSVVSSPEQLLVEATCDYGEDPTHARSLSLALDSSLVLDTGVTTTHGYLSIKSSEADTMVDLSYKYRPGLAEAYSNITILSTQMSSRLVARNMKEDASRDLELSLSLDSPQWPQHYLGRLVYKVSDSAFQAEAEVNLGPLLRSKMSVSYLLEDEPLHMLTGLHIQLNDYIIQAGYNIDLSKDNQAVVLVSSTIGGASGVFRVNAEYDSVRPLNVSLEAFAGYGNLQAGISVFTSSDHNWQHFTGKTEVKWFSASVTVDHDVLWTSHHHHLKLYSGETSLVALAKTSPSPVLELEYRSNAQQHQPAFKVAVGKQKAEDSEAYEAYMTLGPDKLFHLAAAFNMDGTLSGRLRLLESEVQVSGQLSRADPDHLDGSAHVTITLPSGQAFTSNLNISHTFDGTTRDVKVWQTYKGEVTECRVRTHHRDGWLEDDSRGFLFSLTTPFALLSNLTLVFEKHGDPSTADFLEVQWEELKVRGEAQLGDLTNMEVKLLYENGGTCDSHLNLYHKYDGQQYLTGASLALTQAHGPWEVKAVTSLSQSGRKETTDIKLDFQSPMLTEPFQLHGVSDITENYFNLLIQAGMVEKLSLILSVKNELELNTHKFLASLDLDTHWTDPVHLNVTNTYNDDSFNTTLDFWSFLYPINSVTAELKASYVDHDDVKAHLYFSHDQIQVVMDLIHNMTNNSLNDHFQISANRLKLNFDFDTEWEEDFVPITATGQFSVENLFAHKLELTFSHTKEHNIFSSQLIGLWDSQTFKLDNKLNWNQPLSPLNRLQTTPLEQDNINLAVNSNFHFMSPWTKSIKADVTIQMMDSKQNAEIDVLLDDASVLRLKVQTKDPISWCQADVALEASSFLFHQIEIKWKHNLVLKNFVLIEISRGVKFPSSDNIFYFRGTSNLMYKQGWLKQEFEQLEISAALHHPSSPVDFNYKISIDSQFRGNFEIKWNEYIFSVTSAVLEGLIFKGKVGSSELAYGIEVKSEKGNSNIQDLHFKLTKYEDDILILASKFESVYPKFDALFSLRVLLETNGTVQNGQLRLTADLTDIKKYAFSGALKLDSDFEGFEKYWAELDTGMISRNHFIGAHLNGLVHIGNWHYKAILNGSLDFDRSFSVEYRNLYDLTYKDKLIDTKEISLLLNITYKIGYQGKLALNFGLHKPHWSLFILYNDEENAFNSYIIPGNSKKYELSIQVFNNKFSLETQITDADGSRFQVLQGNINWNIRRKKKQFSINMNSDFDAIRKIIGQVIVQQKRDLAANAKFRVNDENFVGSLRYIAEEKQNTTSRIIVKVDNNIYIPMKTDTNINFSFNQDQYESDLVVDLNDEKEWFRANVKASLPDSHIQLHVPYKGLENIDVSVNINAEDNWEVKMAIQVPKFCAEFEGMLDKSLTKSSISIKIQADCTGESIFDFNFNYNLREDSFNAASDCYVQDYGLIYKYEISSKALHGEASVKVEGHLYPDHSLGVELSTDFGRDKHSLYIRAYEVHYNMTHFLYSHSFSENSTGVLLELNQNKLFSLQAKYDLKKPKLDASYFHSLFGSPLNVKLTLQGNVTETRGNVNFLLTTDAPFDHVDLLVTYDLRDKKEASLKLTTTLGDAEGKVVFLETESTFSITADLISSLHSSHEYYFKLDHEREGDNHKIKVMSVQDDIEFQLKGSSHREDDMSIITLSLLTPFKEYESLDVGFGYPESDTQESLYEAHIHAVSLGNLYGIEINHDQEPGITKKTEIVLLSPRDVFGNISASLMYGVGSQAVAAAQLNTSQGNLGIDGTFKLLERSMILNLNCDITLLDFGQYFFKADMPYDLLDNSEIRLERNHTDSNFIGHFTGHIFRHANISLILTSETPVLENTSYMLSYILDSSLEINCQFEIWKANAVFELVRNKSPELSGSFMIKTNIPGYEEVDGTWGIGHRAAVYFAQININMQQQGTITFNSTFDIQPNGARKVLESMQVNIMFASPYTLAHHLQAEYNLAAFNLEASYKYGLDVFHIKLNSKLKRKIGTVSLAGNIPVQGISTFNINFNYKLKEYFDINLIGVVEETAIQAGCQLGPDGTAMASLTSPFILPIKASLSWSFIKSPLQLEASCTWGEYAGALKVIAKDNVNSKQLEFLLTTPFNEFNKLDIKAQYTFSESNELHISVDLGVNHHTFKVEATFINNISETKLEISGIMDAFEKQGSLKITFGKSSDVYEGKLFGTITGYEAFHFTINLDTQHINSSIKYGHTGVFNVKMNVSQIILEFAWAEHTFNLTATLTPTSDGYQFELSLTSSVTKPVTAHLAYSEIDGHKGYGNITVGETVYTVNATIHLNIQQSSLEFRFESSDNPHTPIIVKAMYDLTNFLNYRMNAMTDLASASFEWGDVLAVTVTGMSHNNRVKINIEISTPFKSLPKLLIGYDGEFSYERSAVDFTFTSYVDWSKQITLTGFYKFKNEELDLRWALTTPFTVIERLSASFKFNSSHIKLSLVHNNDEWSILGDYQLSPAFSLTLTGKTPFSGFEKLSFESSAGFQDGLFRIEADLSWQNNRKVKIQVLAGMWNLEIQIYTPWKTFKEVIFKTSLRTESEELMYTSTLEWDKINTSLTLIYSPVQFKLLGRYEENSVETVLVRVEYIYNGQEFKSEIELQTPINSFTLLEAALDLGLQGQQFRTKLIINGKTNVLEGIFSVTGGKFTVDIPALWDFVWTVEASNIWMKMDTQVSFAYPTSTSPLTTSLNYQLNPNDGKGRLHIKFESLDQWLESLNFTISADHVEAFAFIEASSDLLLKFRNQELFQYNVNMSSSVMNGQASLAFVYEAKQSNIPYQMSCKISLLNMFLEEGIIEFVLSKGAEEIYKLSYETVFPDEGSSSRQIALKSPEWAADIRITITEESNSISLSYPDPTVRHTLLLTWPEDFNLEKFTVGFELNSPYIENITFYMNFMVQQKFTFSLDSRISYGSKEIDVTGIFQYTKKLHQAKCDVQVTSAWLGAHSFKTNIQWLHNITANVKLISGDEKHNVKLHINPSNHSLELTCNSAWLPYENILITGRVDYDYEPLSIIFEGQLRGDAGGDKFVAKAELVSEGLNNTTFLASLTQNGEELFKMSLIAKFDEQDFNIEMTVDGAIPELTTIFTFVVYDNDKVRYLSVTVNNRHLLKNTYLQISNSKYWRNEQKLRLSYDNLSFEFRVELGSEQGRVDIKLKSDCFEVIIYSVFGHINDNDFEFELKTSFEALRDVDIRIKWEDIIYIEEIDVYIRTMNDKDIICKIHSIPDSVMGRSISVSLTTPFKGYEKIGFVTPQFDSGNDNNILRVLLEYPGGKVGIILRSSFDTQYPVMQLSIYLPFEKYEIISFHIETNLRMSILEMRIGKVGITLSAATPMYRNVFQAEFVIRLNENSIKAIFRSINQKPQTERVTLKFELYPKEFLGIDLFFIEFEYNPCERIYFAMKTDQEELVKAHVAWGSDKVFAITTPKRYPGFLILNLESTKELNDFRFQVGFALSEDGSWETYGVHAHQEILDAGRHLSLSGEALESQFHVEGTFSFNSFHWNESLIFELNRQKIGYKVLLQRDPGLFSSAYVGDINLLLPTRKLHYKANAIHSNREFEIMSYFAWNEYETEKLPFTLRLNYIDNSLFGHKKHYLKTVLSHPDIKDIILQGNVTQARNSPLYGKAELIDGNSPERNIEFLLDIQPTLDKKEQNVLVNISQPTSGFLLSMNAMVAESVFTKADYTFRYWSLSKEMWQDLRISTDVNTNDSGYNFAAKVFAPQGQWGYSYNGHIHSWDNLVKFKIQGNSETFEDFWKIGTDINKHLPELLLYLDVGQKDQEEYEEGRIRIGLHNPLELGAILDHKRFGKWNKDCAVGLRLLTSDILQFIVEFDPSLDYSDNSLWAQLTSPADQILKAWQRDLTFTASAFKHWVSTEARTAAGVLVNNQAVQAVWESEKESLGDFMRDIEAVVSSISEDMRGVWSESLHPAVVSLQGVVGSLHEELEGHLQDTLAYIRQQLDTTVQCLEERLEVVVGHFAALHHQLISWWTQGGAEVAGKVVEAFWEAMHQTVLVMNLATDVLLEALTSTQRALHPILQHIQHSFIRYGQELYAVLDGHCWNLLKQMTEELAAEAQESVSIIKDNVREFLQLEEYYSRLLRVKNTAEAWLENLYSVIQAGVESVKEAVLASPVIHVLHRAQEMIHSLASEISSTAAYDHEVEDVRAPEPQDYAQVKDILKYMQVASLQNLKKYETGNLLYNYINIAAGNVYERVVMAWQRWREEMLHTLATFHGTFFSLIDAVRKLRNGTHSFNEEPFIFEADVYGRIIVEQRLPVPWPSFLEAPHWHTLTHLFQEEPVIDKVQRLLAEGMDDIEVGWEVLGQPGALSPPFAATATIMGQHITTFDLHHYHFLGSCSYLLTRDFIGGDFTVVGVYEGEAGVVGLQAVVVHGHSATVTIHLNGTIDVSQAGAETYTSGDRSGVKMGGLLVTCNKVYQGCSITVSGKYFGRLAGLLGNYNYERSDDTRGPDGARAYNAANLATRWAVSSTPCYQANQATQMEDVSEAHGVDECAYYFLSEKNSPFRSCFFLVNPRPYFWHCINSFSKPGVNDDEKEDASCQAAASYRTQCLAQGVRLPPSHYCHTDAGVMRVAAPAAEPAGTCEVAGEMVPSGWSHTFQGENQGSADIALIIELANCNKDKNLQQLIQLLKVHLRKSAINDVRYALITVQGENVTPASAFMNDEQMSTLLGTLTLEGPKVDSGGAEAVISAAKHLRWRPGVSRNIVQMSCRVCDQGDQVLQALRVNDVSFHIISKFKVTMNGPTTKKSAEMAAKLIGFDENVVFTPKDLKQLTGSEKLRGALQVPEGSCVMAAQASGGSVFNINKWISKNNEAAKKFLRVLSLRVVVSSSAPECQECRCLGRTANTTLLCYKCSHTSYVQDLLEVWEAQQPQTGLVEDNMTLNNISINSDIKRDFAEQFMTKNAAFALVKSGGGAEDEDSSSSSEESDEEDGKHGEEKRGDEEHHGEEEQRGNEEHHGEEEQRGNEEHHGEEEQRGNEEHHGEEEKRGKVEHQGEEEEQGDGEEQGGEDYNEESYDDI